MSQLFNPDKYINPIIPSKSSVIYKNYSKIKQAASSANFNSYNQDVIFIDQPNPDDYPSSADHARFPVMVHCKVCSQLSLTQIEYEHGFASKLWCMLLLPFLCTGACCLCLNSCKDVKHTCGNCHEEVGKNKSRFC